MYKHIIHDDLVSPYPRISFIIKKSLLNIEMIFFEIMMEVVIIMASYNSQKLPNHMTIILDYSFYKKMILKLPKKNWFFLKKLIIHFLRVEIDPRLWYLIP
jgi:hypothetical protein